MLLSNPGQQHLPGRHHLPEANGIGDATDRNCGSNGKRICSGTLVCDSRTISRDAARGHLRSATGGKHVDEAKRLTTDEESSRHLRDLAIAWGLVAVQAVLIVGILLTPIDGDWPLPPVAVAFTTALTWLGIALIVWAILVFGRGVTPSPLPSNRARLQTRGPYRWIRHPMYTGVILLMADSAIGRRNWFAAVLWVVLVVFFLAKMRWEERRLIETYPGYDSYREAVPALIPFGSRAAPVLDSSVSV